METGQVRGGRWWGSVVVMVLRKGVADEQGDKKIISSDSTAEQTGN